MRHRYDTELNGYTFRRRNRREGAIRAPATIRYRTPCSAKPGALEPIWRIDPEVGPMATDASTADRTRKCRSVTVGQRVRRSEVEAGAVALSLPGPDPSDG